VIPTIKFFWQFIEALTIEEKYEYLKFVWGRTRLPRNDEEFKKKHAINHHSVDENSLPIAHTCFFSIDLPPYSTFEILRDKISYSMKNSYLISDSSGDVVFNLD